MIIYLIKILFFGIFINSIKIRILRTGIVSSAPILKLHHVVLLTNNNLSYTVDFSPIKKIKNNVQFDLLLGKDVPAEIRVRRIQKANLTNDTDIIKEWVSYNKISTEESIKLSTQVIQDINDKEIKKIIYDIKDWNNTMNLYKYNCQHFSSKVKKNIKLMGV